MENVSEGQTKELTGEKLIEKLEKENEQLKNTITFLENASNFWRMKYLREIGAKARKGEMRGEVERKGD